LLTVYFMHLHYVVLGFPLYSLDSHWIPWILIGFLGFLGFPMDFRDSRDSHRISKDSESRESAVSPLTITLWSFVYKSNWAENNVIPLQISSQKTLTRNSLSQFQLHKKRLFFRGMSVGNVKQNFRWESFIRTSCLFNMLKSLLTFVVFFSCSYDSIK
jgi:hypothetical protein